MAVPYSFGSATSAIPLSQLDSNFATTITLGNTAIQLGNTVTTLNNMTLANVAISSGSVTLTSAFVTNANVTSTLTLDGGTANGVAYLNGSKQLTTGTDLVFTSTGLGIGTSSPSQKLQVNGSSPRILLQDAGTGAPLIDIGSGGGSFYVGSDNSTGSVFSTSAYARLLWGIGAYPMVFATNGTERARIDSSGRLLVNNTTAASDLSSSVQFAVYGTGYTGLFKGTTASSTVINSWNSATTGNNQFVEFFTEAAVTSRGSITYNRGGGLVAYNVTSDYRAKDIYGPVVNSGALIDSVPVYMGKMKGATQERPMFIAHETPSYAHTGEKDAVDKDGNPVYQQMDASALVPVMWAEIQSLRQRLAAAGI